MTEILRAELRGSKEAAAFGKLEQVLEEDSKPNADIEYMLSLVRALGDVAGATGARGLSREELEEMDEAISNGVADLAKPILPSTHTAYHDVMRWVGAVVRERPVELFTTNYDLLAEQALEDVRVPYFDGFVGAREAFFDVRAIEEDALPARWARLWKLHGSINWCRSDNGGVVRRDTAEGIDRRLIHPSHLKYDESRRMPYLALFDRLRTFLRYSNAVLITCGYSFRDEHLNEVFREGLERNAGAAIFGLLHGGLDRYENAVRIAQRVGNLLLLAPDGAVVGRTRGPWRTVDGAEAKALTPGLDVDDERVSVKLGDFAELASLFRELAGGRQ
jgi:hypothetical protein